MKPNLAVERFMFIPHSGFAKVQPIDLPSSSRISHRPTVQIQELVALSYGLNPKCMTARWRGAKHVSWARQVAMYLTRKLTNRSLTAIGGAFGCRDHTTVMHAVRKVEERMKADPLDYADVAALRKVLEG